VDWIGLAQDSDNWRTLVKEWTFGLHEMLGNCRVATQLVGSRAVFSFLESVCFLLTRFDGNELFVVCSQMLQESVSLFMFLLQMKRKNDDLKGLKWIINF
jgi:hypothetical protein